MKHHSKPNHNDILKCSPIHLSINIFLLRGHSTSSAHGQEVKKSSNMQTMPGIFLGRCTSYDQQIYTHFVLFVYIHMLPFPTIHRTTFNNERTEMDRHRDESGGEEDRNRARQSEISKKMNDSEIVIHKCFVIVCIAHLT